MSSAKLALQDALEQSRLPDDPGLEPELLAAFPPAMRRKFGEEIRSHRLRREIIATRIANRLINRIGPIHTFELVEEEGASLAQVAGAFVAAERLLRLRQLERVGEAPRADARASMGASVALGLALRELGHARADLAEQLRGAVGGHAAERAADAAT